MLKTKIPPPVIALFFIALQYLSTYLIPAFRFDYQTILAVICLVAGFSPAGIAFFQFKNNDTTIDPRKPENSTELVVGGVFKYSRNPMYVGLTMVLVSASLFLGAWSGLVLIPVFILVINHLQILPEEEAMKKLFGEQYAEYCKNVRRWI